LLLLCSTSPHPTYSLFKIFAMFPWVWVDGLWATKSEDVVGLIVRLISFQDFWPTVVVLILVIHPTFSTLILGLFPLHQIAHVEVNERIILKLLGREIIFRSIPTYVITVPKRYGRTDRQTTCNLINALSIASRGKNTQFGMSLLFSDLGVHVAYSTRSRPNIIWSVILQVLHFQLPRQELVSASELATSRMSCTPCVPR